MYTNPTTNLPYRGSILENVSMFIIPTDEEEIASMIYTHSYDWSVVLDFFDKMARAKHIVFDAVSISEKIRQLIGEE